MTSRYNTRGAAKRASSRESSVAETDASTGLLPSLAPSPPSTQKQSLNVAAHAPTHAQAKRAATAFDPNSTIAIIMGGDRSVISKLTKDNLKELAHAFADRHEADQKRIDALESDLETGIFKRVPTSTITKSQHSLKMAEIMRKHGSKKAAEAETQTNDLPPPPPPAPIESAPSPPPATPSVLVTTASTAEPPPSVWRSITNLFATPFSRKRMAEDEPETPAPSQKRQKPTEPAPRAPQSRTTTPARSAMKRPSFTPATAPAKQTAFTPASAASERPSETPASAAATATEHSIATPAPKRKRTNAAATATPLPAIPESSPKPSINTITPRPRTLASARLAASARKFPQSHQPPRRYAWEQAEAKPKMANADERIAKIRRAEWHRRELARLEQEEDFVRKVKRVKVDHLAEIPHNRPGDSAGTFRVPDIDSDDEMEVYDSVEERSNIFSTPQLPAQQPTTPHPQTQQATTPMPPPQLPAQQDTTPLPRAQQATAPLPRPPQLPAQHLTTPLPQAQQQAFTPLSQTPQLPAQQSTTPFPSQQTAQPEPPRFIFPSVAPKPANYHVSDEYKKAAGALFSAGLAAF